MRDPLARFLVEVRSAVDAELDLRLPGVDAGPRRLHEAMRYAVFGGGKRVRPALVVLGGEAFGAPRARLLSGAAAVEMIHAYSLVHDDLPALDDDDLRRGRPTVHRRFDEATAILVGDALLTSGLTLLARQPEAAAEAVRRRAVEWVGEAIGTAGMIGGQADDLQAEVEWPAEPDDALDSIHRRKTGALIAVSLRLGGLYAGADSHSDAVLAELGAHLGLLFQISDDVLDVEGQAGVLGKTPGKDANRRKLTYPALHGLEASRRRLAELARSAAALCAELPHRGDLLIDFVAHLARRSA